MSPRYRYWSPLSLFLLAAFLLSMMAQALPGAKAAPTTTTCASDNASLEQLQLDGVDMQLCNGLLPGIPFETGESSTLLTTVARVHQPQFKELSITVVPFGTRPEGESLPVAQPGHVDQYRTILNEYRRQQGGTPADGPLAEVFGKPVPSTLNVVDLNLRVDATARVAIVEWVTETASRLWIIRASAELVPEPNQALAAFTSSISGLRLSSPDPDRPAPTLQPDVTPVATDQIMQPAATPAGADLPLPGWWSGECDLNNYQRQTGVNSYPLGGSYRGVQACGPRPNWDPGAPNPGAVVRFFPGAWGEFEWQCVELVMRYMYLAYGIAPYSANGSQVVANYRGSQLDKINNGTVGRAPQPGDVISQGATSTFGHTAIVVEASVDANGNGFIRTLNQNLGGNTTEIRQGYYRLAVHNWSVADGVTGWLHDPSSSAPADTTPPTVIPTVAGPTGANGWYTGPTQVSWSLADPESGIASSQGCETVTLSQDTAGTSITCAATNGAGLSQSGSVSLKIDATPPTINLSFDRPYYTRLDTAALHLSATDPQPGSGLAYLEASFDNAPAQDGQQLDLFWRGLGAASVTATASDNAGLVTTRTASFELIATLESLAKTIAALRQRGEIDGDTAAHDLLVIVGRAIAAWQRGENDAAISHLTDLEDAITARSAQISERATTLLLGDTAYVKTHLPPVNGLPEPPAPPRNLTVRSGRTTLLTWEPSPSEWSHGYLVYRKGAGESDFTRVTVVPLEGLTYSDTGVAEGVSYTYYVTAIDEYGRESLPSNSERAFAGHLQLKLPTVRAAPGMTVRVPVQVEYADGLCLEAADVGVAYDPAVATPVGVSRSTLTDSYSFAHAVRKAGEVHISAVGPCSTVYGSGALFWVNFTVAPTATVQSSLDFIEGLTGTTLYDSADLAQPIPLSLSNGAIVVDAARPQLRGDLNGDGVINAADAALALRITVGLLTPNVDQQITGDVNADGNITAADATLILYYAAHQQWPESLAAPAAALRVAQSLRYQVRPETTAGAVGAEVRVPLTIDDGIGLAGSTVLLQYGPGLLFQGAVLDGNLEQRGFTLAVNGARKGEARLSLAGSETLTPGEQRLVWLRFKVADGATNQTTWMKAAGVWLNDQAGRDLSTTGSRPIVVGGRGSVTLSAMPLRVFLPLIQR